MFLFHTFLFSVASVLRNSYYLIIHNNTIDIIIQIYSKLISILKPTAKKIMYIIDIFLLN